MALYDKNTFESLYNDASAGKPFQTNTIRAIVSSIMRQFAKDASDSFLYNLNGQNIDINSFESFDWSWSPAAGALPMGWLNFTSGTGAGVGSSGYGIDSTSHVVGEIMCSTGSTAAGISTLYKSAGQIRFTIGMAYRLRMRCAIETLSTGTDRFTVSIGYTDNANVPANGAFFRYCDNVNGGKWQAVTIAGSVETAVDTGIAATTGYMIFDVSVNGPGTVVTFQIGNNAPVTISTNIPNSGLNLLSPMMIMKKSIGTTSCNLHQDWYSHLISSTTAR